MIQGHRRHHHNSVKYPHIPDRVSRCDNQRDLWCVKYDPWCDLLGRLVETQCGTRVREECDCDTIKPGGDVQSDTIKTLS
jgi:hypothetical protein